MRKKRIGIIEKDLRVSLSKYMQDRNLLVLLKAITRQSDSHIRYSWQKEYFLSKLETVYGEIISNDNPSHREGNVDSERRRVKKSDWV